MRVPGAAGSLLRRVSRRHRRWARITRSLTLDPDDLPSPLPSPGPGDFIMCGSPRSGTALLVAMLFRPPSVVTVMEPWDALRLAPKELFASLRAELSTGELRRGRLDIDELVERQRVAWCRDGEKPRAVNTTDPYQLGVKFPAFWRYLDRLPDTRFLVCLRDPVEVVSSYESTGGRLAQGFDYDVPFNRSMNDHLLAATGDPALRRVLLYDYIHQRIQPHLARPNVHVVRYERWFTEPAAQLAEIGDFLGTELHGLPARLRPPEPRNTADVAALVARHCHTASALGYET